MDINTLLTTIRDAVADDTATKTWTQSIYTKDHHVFLGIDERNPPAESSYPAVSLYPVNKAAGEGQESIRHTVGLSLGIHDESLATGGKTNVTEYNGMQRIETFRQKVFDATATAVTGLSGMSITEIETEYSAIEFFPYFLCVMTITADEETEFGSDFLQ